MNSTYLHKPLLSIIIPARGGFIYSKNAIRSVLSSRDSRVEVLLQDNSFPEDIDYSEFTNDPRFKLFKESNYQSMSDNWYLGLSRASGEFFSFLGVDDGIFTENLEVLLDFLQTFNGNIVSTNFSVFSYGISDEDQFLEIPSKETLKETKIRFPLLNTGLFHHFRDTTCPIPYAKTVVRKAIVAELITSQGTIPGVAPDELLGQYVARKHKYGSFLDLSVFIAGMSDRGTGVHIARKPTDPLFKAVISDSKDKGLDTLAKFGFVCMAANALDHYLLVRKLSDRHKKTIPQVLRNQWCNFTCFTREHHITTQKRTLQKYIWPMFDYYARAARKSWIIANFGRSNPYRRSRLEVKKGDTILEIQSVYKEFRIQNSFN
jgi:hypothetical protein